MLPVTPHNSTAWNAQFDIPKAEAKLEYLTMSISACSIHARPGLDRGNLEIQHTRMSPNKMSSELKLSRSSRLKRGVCTIPANINGAVQGNYRDNKTSTYSRKFVFA